MVRLVTVVDFQTTTIAISKLLIVLKLKMESQEYLILHRGITSRAKSKS